MLLLQKINETALRPFVNKLRPTIDMGPEKNQR